MNSNPAYFHPTAIVEDGAIIGNGTKIWHFCHVRSKAQIGKNVSIGRDGYIDSEVAIGENTRIQNGVSIFKGVEISKNCFVGPHVIFTNDMFPRVGTKSWHITPTILRDSCSIGAGAIIRCGISIGEFAMIGAGAIVTKSVKPFRLALGTPAKEIAFICACGQTQLSLHHDAKELILDCCKENLSPEVLDSAIVFLDTNPETFVSDNNLINQNSKNITL